MEIYIFGSNISLLNEKRRQQIPLHYTYTRSTSGNELQTINNFTFVISKNVHLST
jgi:hypothetical protein